MSDGFDGLRGVLGDPRAVCVVGEAGYDEAVAIWNGAITRRPSVVVRCSTDADVAAALGFAQREGLEVSVRGGGHNYAGFALTDGGLMIDLTPMKAIRVEPEARRAVCGGGTTWGELDGATQEHALAVTGGVISKTGGAGLTLGGGIGWLVRPFGLSCESLVGARVVVADGRILSASANENADLFWAIRGGGGNFGVVTQFEFALNPVGPMVQLGLFLFSPDHGGDLFRFAREYVRAVPSDYGVFLAGLSAPPAPFVPTQLWGGKTPRGPKSAMLTRCSSSSGCSSLAFRPCFGRAAISSSRIYSCVISWLSSVGLLPPVHVPASAPGTSSRGFWHADCALPSPGLAALPALKVSLSRHSATPALRSRRRCRTRRFPSGP